MFRIPEADDPGDRRENVDGKRDSVLSLRYLRYLRYLGSSLSLFGRILFSFGSLVPSSLILSRREVEFLRKPAFPFDPPPAVRSAR